MQFTSRISQGNKNPRVFGAIKTNKSIKEIRTTTKGKRSNK